MSEIINHYVDQHTAGFSTFAGSGLPWLDNQRKSGIAQFQHSGFPSQRDEDWRYTPLRPVTSKMFQIKLDQQRAQVDVTSHLVQGLDSHRLVFIDGMFNADQSSNSVLKSGVVVNSFERLVSRQPELISEAIREELPPTRGFAALNIAFSQDGYLVQIPERIKLDKPLEVIFIAASSEIATQPRNIIRLGKFAEATIIERYVSADEVSALVNSTCQISLEEGARLDYNLVQAMQGSAYQVTSVEAELSANSNLATRTASIGGRMVRNNLTVWLNHPGAHCDMLGVYNISGRQHVDNHTNVIHAAEHCTSRELYKGVLDQRSRAVFHGRVKVEPNAQKTDATQANHNLLLSADTEIDTKPQLEIYADDVKCAHGVTVGQLDQNALFYLRSRGIDEQTAKLMLTRAFVSEVLNEITIQPLRESLDSAIGQRLSIDGAIQ